MPSPPFQDAYNYYSQAANAALPSPESLDRSAARLRSRVDTRQRADEQSTADQFAGRGMANSGARDYAQAQNRYGAQQAYSSGLAQLEDDYDKRRQAGAQILSGIGQNYGNTAAQEGQYGIADREQTLSEQLDPRKVDIAQQQANTETYNAQTERASRTANALNDFLTFMGTFGNTEGGELFNRIFTSGRLGFMNLLGMPTGTAEHPEFDPYSF